MSRVVQYCLIVFSLLAWTAHCQENILVSGYNTQMATYRLGQNYTVSRTGGWGVDSNLTWLQVEPMLCTMCKDVVYAVHEVSRYLNIVGGAVSRWTMERQGLVRHEWVHVKGTGPAHLLVDHEQSMAYTANYAGGSFSAIHMEGMRLGNISYYETFGKGCRDQSHPHETITWGDLVWVVDLGCDMVWHYKKVGTGLVKTNSTSVGYGRGPRHLILHKERNLALLVCEVQNFLQVYSVDNVTGNLEKKQEVHLSTVANNTGAEILIHPNGKWIYVSSRGVGMVILFQLDANNKISKVEEFRLAGTWPRHMALHPKRNLLVVADQMGDKLQLVKLDGATGKMTGGPVVPTPHQPSFVAFY